MPNPWHGGWAAEGLARLDQVQVQPNGTLVLDRRHVDGKWHGSAMFLRVIWQLSCMTSFGKNMVTGDDVTPWGTDLLGVKVQ